MPSKRAPLADYFIAQMRADLEAKRKRCDQRAELAAAKANREQAAEPKESAE